jgi:hypothetical protein
LNWRAALIASVIASGLSGKEFQPKEFMPSSEISSLQTADQMALIARLINTQMGGKEEYGVNR